MSEMERATSTATPSQTDFWESRRKTFARKLGVDLTHAQDRYGRFLDRYVSAGCTWLEVGCGRQILPDWAMPVQQQAALVRRAQKLVGIDLDQAMLEHPLLTHRVKSFGNDMPFKSASFDLITANMVVEHIENPETFLREVHRVLRPGGHLLFHTTNFSNYMIFAAYFVPDFLKHRLVWLLEKRRSEDVFPTWYRMNSVSRIRALAAKEKFAIEDLQVRGSSGTFSVLGPIGWLELLALKAAASVADGHYSSNILCVMKRI